MWLRWRRRARTNSRYSWFYTALPRTQPSTNTCIKTQFFFNLFSWRGGGVTYITVLIWMASALHFKASGGFPPWPVCLVVCKQLFSSECNTCRTLDIRHGSRFLSHLLFQSAISLMLKNIRFLFRIVVGIFRDKQTFDLRRLET